jgi:hypothetical protein
MNPYKILSDAIRAVPSVRYALAVAGIGATVAIILGFIRDPKIAVFGIIITIGLMFILVIFSHAAKDLPGVRWLAATLAWSTTLLFIASLLSVFTAFVFGQPETLAKYFRGINRQDGQGDDKRPPPTLHASFYGTWKGKAQGPTGLSYTIELDLRLNDYQQRQTGISYCTMRLEFLSGDQDSVTFKEHLTQGSCTTGTVTLSKTTNLSLKFLSRDSYGFVVSGTLNKDSGHESRKSTSVQLVGEPTTAPMPSKPVGALDNSLHSEQIDVAQLIATEQSRKCPEAENEAKKVTLLIQEAEEGLRNWNGQKTPDRRRAEYLRENYNEIIKEISSLCENDAYLQLLKDGVSQKYNIDAPAYYMEPVILHIKTLAEEIEVYLKSFDSKVAFKQTANVLVQRAEKGSKWNYSSVLHREYAKNLTFEYNFLLQRVKVLYKNRVSGDLKQVIYEERFPNITAEEVKKHADKLAGLLGPL